MAWFDVDNMVRLGIAPPVPWRRVPQYMAVGSGMGGLGYLGKSYVMQADPAQISAQAQSVESLQSQIRSFRDQAAALQREIRDLATSAPSAPTKGALDDAQLVVTNMDQKTKQADLIYAFSPEWVTTAVNQSIHGGWGFGRDVILGNSLGDTSKNFSGRPLDPMNRLEILKAASQELQSIQQSMAKDLGLLRSARDGALQAAEEFARAAAAQAEASYQQQQQSVFQQNLVQQAQQIELQRATQAQQLAQSQAAFELQLAQQRQAMQQAQLEAEARYAQQVQAAKEAALQFELQQQQAIQQQQQQALAAQAAAEQQRMAQALQVEQARAQQELAFAAQQQQLQLAAQYAQQQAAVQPQGYYPASAPYGPSVGPMTGSYPQAMTPSAWPQWNQAAAAAQAAGLNPGQVVSYGSTQQVSMLPTAAPMVPGVMPQGQVWAPPTGGGIYGMAGLGTGGAAAVVAPKAATQGTFSQVLSALPGLIQAGGTAAGNVILARQGVGPQAPPPAPSGGLGLGAGVGALALGAGALYLLTRKRGGSRAPRRARPRRR